MPLWVDKHRPRSLEALACNPDVTQRLTALAQSGEMPHLLVYGPRGAGKKTRVMALLSALFGNGVERLKLEHRQFTSASDRKVDINTVASNYHIELNPAEAGIYDTDVVQQVIKEMAQFSPLDTSASAVSYKVVVLMEADRLTRNAQAALRRTMEKYSGACRLVLVCNSPSKVIEPVRSRCLGVRVRAPTVDEICGVLQSVAAKERLQLPDELAQRVASESRRNLRRALLMLETCRVQMQPFTPDQPVELPDWERYVAQIAADITREQSPGVLLATRGKLYELLTNCVPPDVILTTLLRELLKKVDHDLKPRIVHWAAFYEHRLQQGNKEIFHLEAFVARFMSTYREFLLSLQNF